MNEPDNENLTAEEVAKTLEASLNALADDCRALTPEQWDFALANSTQWSPAQIIEHLAVIELGIHIKIKGALATADEQSLPANPATTRILRMLSRRGPIRVQAPAFAVPTGRFGDGPTALDSLANARAANRKLFETSQDQLRSLVMPHPFLGPLDGWQWMMFLASHAQRHHAQLKEFLAASNA